MKNNVEIPSLCPYLERTRGKFHLKFSSVPPDASIEDKRPFPFLVLSESYPLARLVEAQCVTDAGSAIKRVFVLLQKDDYGVPTDELRPFNNKDVKQYWQRAFSFYSGETQGDSVIVLSDQIGEDGRLLPFQSLFFCKLKQIFFHPPCPICGSPLRQCHDDELLAGLGLQPYSTSLKRYLFCPSCHDLVGKSDFYVFALEDSDPSVLKDRWELIREFVQLTESKGPMGQFPCLACTGHEECYGSDGRAVSRIAPLGFYPFFMLITEAMSVNASDFLFLISGASFEEVEDRVGKNQQKGRMNCLKVLKGDDLVRTPFLFYGKEEHFLEVLYLKLSFLGELVRTICPGLDSYKYPDLGLSLDRVWVKLANQDGLLPFFWNFGVKLVDVGGNVDETACFPKLPPSYSLYFLGLVWFYALLVNKKQGISEVYSGLGGVTEKITSHEDATFKGFFDNELPEVFCPENIFWNPTAYEGKLVNEGRIDLWERSLDLGWSLLSVSLSPNAGWSEGEFHRKLEDVRTEIKEELFGQVPAAVGQAEPVSADEVIHDVLTRIVAKWRRDLEAKEDKTREAKFGDEKGVELGLEETMILSTAGDEGTDTATGISQSQDEVEETVILSAKKDVAPPSPPEEDVIPETVIMSQSRITNDAPPSVQPKDDESGGTSGQEETMAETVIVSPSERIKAANKSHEAVQSGRADIPGKAASVQRESKDSEVSKEAEDKSEEEDFAAQTVILNPEKTNE